jgi:prepilin-type N-terminal cleavage/methylation domain-containing protein
MPQGFLSFKCLERKFMTPYSWCSVRTGGSGRSRLKRGGTLIEVLISLAIVGLLLTICADLMSRYSLVMRHQEKKNRSLTNTKMALDLMTSEIEEALKVYSPGSDGELVTDVTFWRYNPVDSSRKLADRGGMTISYYLDSGVLYRKTNTAATVTCYPVAHEVKGFSIRRENSKLFTVSVSFEETQRIYTIVSKASLKSGI